jgi:cytochrome c
MPSTSISPTVGQNVGGGKVRSDFSDIGDPDNFVLPEGSAQRGEKLFKKHCAQCHSYYADNRITRQGATQLGPTLFNVYGRASGQMEIQAKAGSLMGGRAEGMVWTAGHLMNYMKNPRQTVDGNIQMNFRGIDDFQKRVDIVHFLKTLDDSNEAVAHPPERPTSVLPVFPFNVIGHYLRESKGHNSEI